MKKFVPLLAMVSLLVGCGSSTPKERTIYDDIADDFYAKEIIAKDVKNCEGETPKRGEVGVARCYGEYNGTYVAAFIVLKTGDWSTGWFQIVEVTVDGYSMTFPSLKEPLCWNDHALYTLNEAYLANLLTRDDLAAINESSREQRRDSEPLTSLTY